MCNILTGHTVTTSDPLLCRCFRVPERVVRTAIRDRGLATVEAVAEATRASTGCGSCYDDIQDILDGASPERGAPDLDGAVVLDVIRFMGETARIEFDRLDGATIRAWIRAGDPAGREALDLKRNFLRRASDALGARVTLLELNVLEDWERRA